MSNLIYRQAAIKVASKECYELRGVFGRIEEGLNELPTVKAIPIEWIREYICDLEVEASSMRKRVLHNDKTLYNLNFRIFQIKELVKDWEKENETNR